MCRVLRSGIFAFSFTVLTAATAHTQPAQAPSTQAGHGARASTAARPASSTFLGDTGFWSVPTAEILPAGTVAISGYRVSVGTTQQFAELTHVAGGVAVGIADRLEIFGSIRPQSRRTDGAIPADQQPTGFGDIFVGTKVNVASQGRQQPVAFAVRGIVKLPTADEFKGLGTGDLDVMVDGIVSREIKQRVEVAGYAGVVLRQRTGAPELSPGNALRWGIAAAVPTRAQLRVVGELYGENSFSTVGQFVPDSISVCDFTPEQCTGFSLQNPLDAFLGLDYRHRSGFFAGAGVGFIFQSDAPGPGAAIVESQRLAHLQIRVGFHPGARP